MAIELDLQLAVENEEGLPSQQDFQLWQIGRTHV